MSLSPVLSRSQNLSLKIQQVYLPGQSKPGVMNSNDFCASGCNKREIGRIPALSEAGSGDVAKYGQIFSFFKRIKDSIFLCEIF